MHKKKITVQIAKKYHLYILLYFIFMGCFFTGFLIAIYGLETLKMGAYQIGKENIIGDLYFNFKISQNQKELKEVTINLTRGCRNDEACYFFMIYDFLVDFDYIKSEEGLVYSPKEILDIRAGDCKNMVVIFCSMMRNVGQDCYWSSSDEFNHIIALTKVNQELVAVDLASDFWMPINTTDDYWNSLK